MKCDRTCLYAFIWSRLMNKHLMNAVLVYNCIQQVASFVNDACYKGWLGWANICPG